jgi:hypothetical protein
MAPGKKPSLFAAEPLAAFLQKGRASLQGRATSKGRNPMSTRRMIHTSALVLGTLAATFAVGCGAANDERDESPEAEEIAAALELENGGLDMADEAPMFGAELAFADAVDPESPIADEVAELPEVQTLSQKPDAAKIEVALLWGQLPGNLQNKTPHNWSGKISVSRGAMIVRRTIRFEDKGDHLLPRTSPQEVAFTSITLPHHDGLRLTVLDPNPLAPEPLVLTYETKSGVVYKAPIGELVGGPKSVPVDEAGNRFVGIAMAKPVDVCQFGMLGGKWQNVAPGRGRMAGVVVNPVGDPIGHVKGVYGHKKNGEQVFFGKYIDAQGHFRGIFAGKYGEGHYQGKWMHASGDVGVLGGHYFDAPGKPGGKFMGGWAETSCNMPVGPGAPPPPGGPGLPPPPAP